jgi:hypothetical protein
MRRARGDRPTAGQRFHDAESASGAHLEMARKSLTGIDILAR